MLRNCYALYKSIPLPFFGSEPEAITLGKAGTKKNAFVGMERADSVAVYNLTNPAAPVFIKMFATGYTPKGVLFLPAFKRPIQ